MASNCRQERCLHSTPGKREKKQNNKRYDFEAVSLNSETRTFYREVPVCLTNEKS